MLQMSKNMDKLKVFHKYSCSYF